MSIRKFRAARVTTTNANIYVGQYGDIYYDESLGQLHLSDGVTPGGSLVFGAATTTKLGGIKAGPGANVSVDGTLTINTAGIPLSIGDLAIAQANITTANANEDLNLLTNGTGNVNLVGNVRLYSTGSGQFGYDATPLMAINNTGTVMINGALTNNGNVTFIGTSTFQGPIVSIGTRTSTGDSTFLGNITANGISTFNGNTVLNGNVIFVGPTYHSGNVTTNGNLIVNGSSYFNGSVTEVGNLNVTGNLISTGPAYYTGAQTTNGDTTFNGNITVNGISTYAGPTVRNGNVTTNGNSFINGNLYNTGYTINNGVQYQNGNLFVTGNTTFTVTVTSSNQGAVEITGNAQGLYQPPQNSGTTLHTTGLDTGNVSGRVYFDSINNYAVVAGRRYNGTIANPTALTSGQIIVRYAGTPYTSVGWPTVGPSSMNYVAGDNMTGTAQGGFIQFLTTANGTPTSSQFVTATIDPAIGVWATGFQTAGNVSAGNVIISGTEYSNSISTGNITAGNVNATLHGNVVGVASSVGTNTTSFASTFISGQVSVPTQTIAKNTTSLDVTVTVTGLTTSHKVMVMPASDMIAGVVITAAYPTASNTLGFQMQMMEANGGGTTTSAFNLTYWAWI
jgi:hypothetical protein